MAIWFVVAIPPLIMFFALAMERVEKRLRRVAVQENLAVQQHEVEEFLQTARADEVRALFGGGIGRASDPPRRPGQVTSLSTTGLDSPNVIGGTR